MHWLIEIKIKLIIFFFLFREFTELFFMNFLWSIVNSIYPVSFCRHYVCFQIVNKQRLFRNKIILVENMAVNLISGLNCFYFIREHSFLYVLYIRKIIIDKINMRSINVRQHEQSVLNLRACFRENFSSEYFPRIYHSTDNKNQNNLFSDWISFSGSWMPVWYWSYCCRSWHQIYSQ